MGRWEETKADQQDMPNKECHGCGSDVSHLFTMPGQLRSIHEAWWHIPCYNAATPDAKNVATAAAQEAWAQMHEVWAKRATRHCKGGPGGAEHQARMAKKLGPIRYAKHVEKVKRDTAAARVKRQKARELERIK